MDFTPDLSAFRGILTSLNNVHPFSKLSSRGGNEEKLDYIIEGLTKFLKDRRYINDFGIIQGKESEMMKFALFIVLNSDLQALGEIVDNEHIDSVIWAIPTIPRFLMTYLIIKLHMESFLYNMISYCNPQLSIQLSTAILEHIKWLNPEDSLTILLHIASAAYHLTCRLHFFKYDNDVLTDILITTFNSIQHSLNYFTAPPNAERLLKLKKNAEYKYKGKRLLTMLSLIKKCLEYFTCIEPFNAPGFDQIYQLTYKPKSYSETDLNFEMCNSPNRVIGENMEKYLSLMLDKCMELVMDVSVDIYCSWSEFRMDGKEMQQVIGVQSYQLCKKLLNTKCFAEHPVLGMLHEISRKPEEVIDVVNETDIETIIENINNNDASRREWVQALVCKDSLLNETQLIQLLMLNMNALTHEDAMYLYERCMNYLETSKEPPSEIKLLQVKSFERCDTTKKHEILQKHFKDNFFTDELETTEFHNMMMNIFNKIINSQDADLFDVLSIFLQNPQKVFEKIVSVATDSTEQGEVMVKALRLLDSYTQYRYREEPAGESCLYRIIKDFFFKLDTEGKQRNFISFVCAMKENACITDQELLHLIIMPNLHTAMVRGDMQVMNVSCKILYDAISLNKLMECKTPMLVMLAQVLEAARWSIGTFQADRVQTLQTVLLLQNTLISFYSDDVPEDELCWLREKLKDIQPLNRYYYRSLWDRTDNNFVQEVGGPKHAGKIEQLVLWLSQILCICTLQEWYLIWDSLDYLSEAERLDIFATVVHVLIASEKSVRKRNSWNCMLHVIENFISLLRYKYLTYNQEPYDEVRHAIDKIAFVVNAVEEKNSESVRAVLMPLVAYLVENSNKYSINTCELLKSKLKYQDMVPS